MCLPRMCRDQARRQPLTPRELAGCASTVPRAIEASRGVGTSGPEVTWPKSPMAVVAAE